MCDNRAMLNYSLWYSHFYHQYLQQHARMTQWIQNLHQNLPRPCENFTNHETQACGHYQQQQQVPVIQQGIYNPQQVFYNPQQGLYNQQQVLYNQQQVLYNPQQVLYNAQQGLNNPQQGHYVLQQGLNNPQQGHYILQQGHYIPQQVHYIPQQEQHVQQHQRHAFKHRENSRRNSHYNPQHRSRSQTTAEYVSDDKVDVQAEDNGDGELVLNVDAILAFRAAKEESGKEEDAKTEESFEFVDTILDENFEFVGLDDAGQMQKMFGRKIAPDVSEDVEYDREARILLFGDRADRIAGLETSLEIMFDRLNDLHQPVVYPHA